MQVIEILFGSLAEKRFAYMTNTQLGTALRTLSSSNRGRLNVIEFKQAEAQREIGFPVSHNKEQVP